MSDKKLTVADFVNASKNYSIVRIEVEPGVFESLDSTAMNVTEVFDLMSLSLLNTLNDSSLFIKQFGSIMEPNQGLNQQDIKSKLFDLLIDQGVIHLIRYNDYDKETLDAFKTYQCIEQKED